MAQTASWAPLVPGSLIPAGDLRPLELYTPGDLFSWPELQSLCSDGILAHLFRDAYVLPGQSPTASLRARAAARGVPASIRRRVVAGRMTAAWIHGCSPPPERLALLVDSNHRISALRATRGCTLHQVTLGRCDVVSLGGLMVSSPLRTAVDLALHVPAEFAVPALQKLLQRRQGDVRLRLLELAISTSPRLPHKVAALEKLAASAAALVTCGAVDVEDSVNAPDSVQDMVQVLGVPHLKGEL